eukprot:gene23602-29838_t
MPRLLKLNKTDNGVSSKEGCPHMLVTKHQTLRLVFMNPPPNCVSSGEVFSVKMCIGNDASPTEERSASVEHLTVYQLCSGSGRDENKPLQPITVGADGKVSLDLKIIPTNSTSHGALPCGVEVVPVLSLPIELKPSVSTSNSQIVETVFNNANNSSNNSTNISRQAIINNTLQMVQDQHAYCIRDVLIGNQTYVYALESPGFLGIGGKVWDSTYILLKYLACHRHELIAGRRVLELGSGTGLAGIALCSLNPQSVILTDMTEVAPLLRANIELNSILQSLPALKATLNTQYTALPHNWGESLVVNDNDNTTLNSNNNANILSILDCDVIIASDVVYDPCAYQPLIDSLFVLLKPRVRVSAVSDSKHITSDDHSVSSITTSSLSAMSSFLTNQEVLHLLSANKILKRHLLDGDLIVRRRYRECHAAMALHMSAHKKSERRSRSKQGNMKPMGKKDER